jgi:thiol:disulfide interchange protein/DsbC/DsbD-like thiol-disulfide interchange protein
VRRIGINGTERGCPTRSGLDCQVSARKTTGILILERAAAETAALRRFQDGLRNSLLRYALLAVLFCLAAFTVSAAHTQVRLLVSADTAKPGDAVWAGVEMKMEPGWHTYWKNPGDAGMATKIEWQLPPGVTAGDIQWPLPEKLPPAEVTTYGYKDEVVLLVPLRITADLKPGPLDLKAKVSWLECKEACLPGNVNVEATLNVGTETKASAETAVVESWQRKIPFRFRDNYEFAFAWWEKPTNDDTRPVIIMTVMATGVTPDIDWADFFPYSNDDFEILAKTENIQTSPGVVQLRKFVKKYTGDWPKEIGGVLVMGSNKYGGRFGFEFSVVVSNQPPADVHPAASATSPALPSQPLWRMLLYAFIGGLILNIMPCVLPVIALKILGFVSESRSDPRHVRKLGLVYALGVLVSFLVLAAVVIGVKAAGHHAGWGMQFGSPVFVVCLTTLVMLVALNLFGVFEITLSGRVLDAASGLASKHGTAGAFFNGLLTTVLATSCTAPILGTALGFAFREGEMVILLVFLTVGIGLAAPYVVLSSNPAWLKFLPRPGAWMERFKIAMGFPMLATTVWLFLLAAGYFDKSRTLWFGLFLVALGLAAWIWGEFVQRGTKHRGLARAVSILLAGGVGTYAFCQTPDQIEWQSWNPEAVAKAQAAGRPVFVDFTADWCVNCQANKKFAIEVPSVRAKLKSMNAVALLGDYTHFTNTITTELNRFSRAGVPLVLVYPKNPGAQPIVLPEILTPGLVLDALDRAAH